MTVLSPFTLSSHRERYATKGGRAYKNMRYLGAIISFSFIVTTASAARTRLTWVNGIGYSLDHMKKGQKEISKMFGGKQVEYYHNVSLLGNVVRNLPLCSVRAATTD